MARRARGEILDPKVCQTFHTVARCVRGHHLCGVDKYTGQSFEYRRQWIVDRLKHQAAYFAIDNLTYAVMGNHVHLVLRSRPDLARSWSDQEVVDRWIGLCPYYGGKPMDQQRRSEMLEDRELIEKLRFQLSDISWWMRLMCQSVARQANIEDQCFGRFWDGRYFCQILVDEEAILACIAYVDSNPIRAGIAESLEESDFTGVQARIDDLKQLPKAQRESLGQKRKGRPTTRNFERTTRQRNSGFLCPMEIDPTVDPAGVDPATCGRRASLKGFLTMPVTKYLQLLDWTARQYRSDKRGAIPGHVIPILNSLGIDGGNWVELIHNFGRVFRRKSGNKVELSSMRQPWEQGNQTTTGRVLLN